MIPKKIHFCWLSGDEYPDLIKKCIESWKQKLPDYEFILWDTNKFKLEENIWVKQAFETKKYAFAADYIRLYAVFNFGGIYLDTDIEVLKSFDSLLHLPYFVGSEGGGILEAGVIGAEPKSFWVGKCLNYYDNKSFIKNDGTFDMLTLPRIMMHQISKNNIIIKEIKENITLPLVSEYSNDKLIMFSSDYFCAKNHGTGKIEVTKNTYCIHHFAMSWLPKSTTFLPNIKRRLMRIIGVKTVEFLIQTFRLDYIRKTLTKK